MTIKSYTSRPSAVRGLARHLGNANTDGLDLAKLIKTDNGQFFFDTDEADAAVGLGGLSAEDENLKLSCGHVNCPHCGVHLSNGLTDFDGMADSNNRGEKEAFKVMQHEWMCLGCNGQWGAPIELKGSSSSKPTKTGRKYPNRNHSDIESPSELVFGLADTMTGAKRKEVVDAAIAKGVTPNTARAAYQHWRKARGLSKTA